MEEVVIKEDGESARRRRGEEDTIERDALGLGGCGDTLDLGLQIGEALVRILDWPSTCSILYLRLLRECQQAFPSGELVRVLSHLLQIGRRDGKLLRVEAREARASGCHVVSPSELAIIYPVNSRVQLLRDQVLGR